MNVPCFTIGSWYDFMCVGSVESFIGRQHRGGPDSRGKQQLLIGPWLHGGNKVATNIGELSYPENARFAVEEHMIRWFDHYLKGIDNGVEREPAVRYYVMGAVGETGAPGNEWRTAADWPVPAGAESVLPSRGGQARRPTRPAEEESATDVPGRPAASQPDSRPGIPRRARRPELREAGRGADFHQRRPDRAGRVDGQGAGRAVRLLVGKRHRLHRPAQRRLSRRPFDPADGLDPPGPLPRRATRRRSCWSRARSTKVAFDVGWTSQVFNRGHRIRVTVASTGAPFYEPNPNTGEPLTIEPPKASVVARNKVHHDRRHASRVIAPVR